MAYEVNHIHIKSPDPAKAVEWYVKAFNFKVLGDTTRTLGDRFIRCQAEGGMIVVVSNARTGEKLNPGDANAHWGVEHFGVAVENVNAEIKRLEGMGATLLDGPIPLGNNRFMAFIKGPDDARIEIIGA